MKDIQQNIVIISLKLSLVIIAYINKNIFLMSTMDYLDTTIKISDYHKTFRILYNYYFFKFRKKYLKIN